MERMIRKKVYKFTALLAFIFLSLFYINHAMSISDEESNALHGIISDAKYHLIQEGDIIPELSTKPFSYNTQGQLELTSLSFPVCFKFHVFGLDCKERTLTLPSATEEELLLGKQRRENLDNKKIVLFGTTDQKEIQRMIQETKPTS